MIKAAGCRNIGNTRIGSNQTSINNDLGAVTLRAISSKVARETLASATAANSVPTAAIEAWLFLLAARTAISRMAIAGAEPAHSTAVAVVLFRARGLKSAVETSVSFVALAATVVTRSKARAGQSVLAFGALTQLRAIAAIIAALAMTLAVNAASLARTEVGATIGRELHAAIWAAQSRGTEALSMKTESNIRAVFGASRNLSTIFVGEARIAKTFAEFADTVACTYLAIGASEAIYRLFALLSLVTGCAVATTQSTLAVSLAISRAAFN